VVVVSGRAFGDVAARVDGAPVAAIVGNHGAEPSPEAAAARASVARWRAALGELPDGVVLEDKGLSLTLHYRHAPDRAAAEATLRDRAERLGPDVRLVGGKCVLNLVPASLPHKGDAIRRLWALYQTRHALYVGDDVTDEDVFRLADPRLVTVRIGPTDQTAARFALPGQEAIDELLQRLLAARGRAARAPGG
jgi:trehalose 6-phosphate phosphatase